MACHASTRGQGVRPTGMRSATRRTALVTHAVTQAINMRSSEVAAVRDPRSRTIPASASRQSSTYHPTRWRCAPIHSVQEGRSGHSISSSSHSGSSSSSHSSSNGSHSNGSRSHASNTSNTSNTSNGTYGSSSSAPQAVSLPPANYNLALLKIAGLSMGTLVGAYLLHPYLLNFVTDLWNLDAEGKTTGTYESNFFSFVSIVYAIMIGNTFTFLYTRQERIIAELYSEVFCVEVLLQEVCLAVEDQGLRLHLVAYLRQYVVEELYNPLEMQSPFQAGSPLLAILSSIRTFRQRGDPEAAGMLRACEALAAAQSSRSASASQILPGVHWLFIYAVLFILVVTSLIFEATSDNPHLESRRLIFSAQCGLLGVIVQLLQDLSKPLDGLYTFRGALDVRLSYVVEELDRCLGGADLMGEADAAENGGGAGVVAGEGGDGLAKFVSTLVK